MRPFEILVFLANLLTCVAAAAPLPRAIRWMHHSAPIAALIAVAQGVVEGPRWQMVPAYTLAGICFLVWLLYYSARMLADPPAISRLAAGLAHGLGLLGLAVSLALPLLLPVFRFPHPSGPYAIGTLTYHWVDADRREIFSADPRARRELMVQIWYPAKGGTSSSRAAYVQDAGALSPALARLVHAPEFIFAHWAYVTTNAVSSAPVSDAAPSYPVLIFLEGLNGFRQMNTFQVEALVAQGYIVAAIDQPYAAASVVFPDGRQITGWTKGQMEPLIQQSIAPVEAALTLNGQALMHGIIPYFAEDVSFTLDQLTALNTADPSGMLTGRLDLHRVGTFGISLGAIVAGESCRIELRLQACLMMDAAMPAAVVQAGLRQPSMWITRDADTMRLERQRSGGWSEADIAQTLTTMRAVFAKSQRVDGYYVQVPGMFHVNLTDAPYWSPLFPWLGVTGPIDGWRAHAIVNAYSLAFFDQHLKGRPEALLDGSAAPDSDVRFEMRRSSSTLRRTGLRRAASAADLHTGRCLTT